MMQTATWGVKRLAEFVSVVTLAGAAVGVAVAGYGWLKLYRTYDEGYRRYDPDPIEDFNFREYKGRVAPPSDEHDRFWSWALSLKFSTTADPRSDSTTYRTRSSYETTSMLMPVGMVLTGLLLTAFGSLGLYYQLQNPSVYPQWAVLGARALTSAAGALTVTHLCLVGVGTGYYLVTEFLGTVAGGVGTVASGVRGGTNPSNDPADTSGTESTDEAADSATNARSSRRDEDVEQLSYQRDDDTPVAGASDGGGQPGGSTATADGDSGDLVDESLDPDSPLDVSLDAFDREDKIGSGGNADVYRATYQSDGTERTVALKLPRLADTRTVDTGLIEEFTREARTWATIDDHDAIVTVLDWGTTPQPWLALEYMDGGNLAQRLPLSPDRAVDVLVDVADAVQYAHRHGIAHRDLKPENVLFGSDSLDSVAVSDWGLAKVLLDQSNSTRGMTPSYAAPEQFDDTSRDAEQHQLTDVYQLGAVTYETLTGRPPFEGSAFEVMEKVKNADPRPPSEVDDAVPAAVDDVVLRALAKEPQARFDTAVHFREELEDAR